MRLLVQSVRIWTSYRCLPDDLVGESSQQGSFEEEADLKDQARRPEARIYLRSLVPMQIKPTQIQSFAIEVDNNISFHKTVKRPHFLGQQTF
jgi:hypothetical protein